MSDRLLLRVGEAADALGVSRSSLYALIQAGVVPAIRLGASLRVPRVQLEQLINERAATAANGDGSEVETDDRRPRSNRG
ncbi:MAG TPA: helix-turn-helix domain-containing protein [Candidatus Limnocylindria bacterium]|nr:helix-turn-helix domain-containing protein [Candidatus Limnocylindria bacterium]